MSIGSKAILFLSHKAQKLIVLVLVVNSRGGFLGLALKLHLLARGDGGGDGRPHLTELPLGGGGNGEKGEIFLRLRSTKLRLGGVPGARPAPHISSGPRPPS